MKALVISDDSNIINACDDFLNAKGFDTIIYRWMLKALDNIEEIRPDCIIISSSEYPRHWKTLVQFVKSGIGGDNIAVYLYEPKPLSEGDLKKAKMLGITGYFTSFSKKQLANLSSSLDEFFGLDMIKEQNIVPSREESGSIMFTNPVTNQFVSGKYTSYDLNKIVCELDFDDFYNELNINTEIPLCTYSYNSENLDCIAVVEDIKFQDDEKYVLLNISDK